MRLLLFILGPSLKAAFRLESLLLFSFNFPLLDAGGGSHTIASLFALFLCYSGAWTTYVLCSSSAEVNCCCNHAGGYCPLSPAATRCWCIAVLGLYRLDQT